MWIQPCYSDAVKHLEYDQEKSRRRRLHADGALPERFLQVRRRQKVVPESPGILGKVVDAYFYLAVLLIQRPELCDKADFPETNEQSAEAGEEEPKRENADAKRKSRIS